MKVLLLNILMKLITEHTGSEAKKVAKEKIRKMQEIGEGVISLCKDLDEIIDSDEENDNQQDTGTKLL